MDPGGDDDRCQRSQSPDSSVVLDVNPPRQRDNESLDSERLFWSGRLKPDSGAITARDLNAMSVASLYDREDEDTKEMETGNDCELDERRLRHRLLARVEEDSDKITSDDDATPEKVDMTKDTSTDCDCPRNPFDNKKAASESLYFADGRRSVDFVLVWKSSSPEVAAVEEQRLKKRTIFEENLVNDGLELEMESVEDELFFTKIHAPVEVLRRYSEILKLRMPMREIPGLTEMIKKSSQPSFLNQLNGLWGSFVKSFLVDETHFPPISHRFTAVYSRDKEYLFDVQQPCFFSAAVRSRIVQFILDRKRFTTEEADDYAFGIDRLISDEVYIAAYPLHDGEVNVPGSTRHLLYTEWAAVSKWYRYQPLDYIKEYFGVKIGLYFAWLGFYTYMLLLASIVGVACFIYSWRTMDSYQVSRDICGSSMDVKMCPLCDHWCDYWDLKETCLHARVTYLFDNPTTVFFAIFMSFWATLFLELWKRYSAEITHRWDLTGFDIHEEHPRPQYLARLNHVRRRTVNVVTNQMEPQVPFWRVKLPATILSFSIVMLLVALAVAAVLAVVLYRMSVLAALSVYGDSVTNSGAILFTTATAASINLCLIILFNWMYTFVAEYLTELELLRTQTEFDDSLTLKIYLLQFVNYYASIFYIAFFKGKFIGYPGDYNRFFNFRQEECGFGGCLMELCIQLAIIMVGKQTMNSILEMLLPQFYRWLNVLKVSGSKLKSGWSMKGGAKRWLRDLKLVQWGSRSLFPEYLEMVLQYGFATIFVAAFPLAPFFALINNVLEMRLDAKKLLTYHRRPVSQRVRDIGIWYRILDCIGKLSVITNGFIIAFTSDFIPRLVYQVVVSPDGSLGGYMNYSLAYFDTRHLQAGSEPQMTEYNVTICRYPDYREPPWSSKRYEKTSMYWHILAARLAFVVVFENIVALVMILVRWCIPDMPCELRDQIRREAYITNEIIIKQETIRARNEKCCDVNAPRATFRDSNPSANFIKMEQIEQLMNTKLSAAQLDLVIHGPDNPVAPGYVRSSQKREESIEPVSL
ncbi:anoctamin-4 isoform X2 [Phlebotomus argentipes]|uniref:anoctamin-4 isoform X2 n=1 Tax=Phlebotomus argentipes TaxID=94469 RepID=UPI002892B045|nr:anoctamin-4 isoform X2 [Phlebotomus argentipes]